MQKEHEHKPHVMSLQICSMIGYLLGLYPAKTAVSPRSPPLEAMREGKQAVLVSGSKHSQKWKSSGLVKTKLLLNKKKKKSRIVALVDLETQRSPKRTLNWRISNLKQKISIERFQNYLPVS